MLAGMHITTRKLEPFLYIVSTVTQIEHIFIPFLNQRNNILRIIILMMCGDMSMWGGGHILALDHLG